MLAATAGCGGSEPTDASGEPESAGGDTAAEDRTAEGRSGGEGEGDGPGEWGPLAVYDSSATSGVAANAGSGILRIRDDCVVLEYGPDDEEQLLAWRSGQVAWSEQDRRIEFEDGRDTLWLEDGDAVGIAGLGWSQDEAEASGELSWLAEPAEDCPRAGSLVHGVTVRRSDR